MQKPIQPQIDNLNKNLKKEIDDRLTADDRYKLTAYKLDERISILEKLRTKLGIRMHTRRELIFSSIMIAIVIGCIILLVVWPILSLGYNNKNV
jgi:hypothetical protein